MSVDLTKLPEPLPPLKKTNGWFWVILLFIFIIIGSLATGIISFSFSVSNLLFILGCLVLPIALWLLSFLYGIYQRGYREAYIKQWNMHREDRKQQLIDFARRGLYVVHSNLMTEYGEGGNGDGVAKGQYAISAKIPTSGNSPIPHSALKLPSDMRSNHFQERIKKIFIDWQREYHSIFSRLPADINLHVRFFIDVVASIENIGTLWQQTLGKTIFPASIHVENVKDSMLFIHQWLDNSDHDNDLLLVINVHLFSSPQKYEAEEALFLLLAGEKAVKNIESIIETSKLVKIYRSEQMGELNKTLDHALLWGADDEKPYDGVWYSSVSIEQNIEIMNYFNEVEFDQGNVFNIDTTIGNARDSAYLFAIALAAEYAAVSDNKQLVIVGEPDITASVVASVTKK